MAADKETLATPDTQPPPIPKTVKAPAPLCKSPASCADETPGHACGVRRNPHVDKSKASKDLRK